MRLSVYYKPKKDEFYVKYYEERLSPIPLLSINHYGHVVIQYIYIKDKKVFWNYNKYEKYLNRKYKHKKPSLRYRIGQAIIKLGKYICFGKKEKVRYVYVYKNQWWRNRY